MVVVVKFLPSTALSNICANSLFEVFAIKSPNEISTLNNKRNRFNMSMAVRESPPNSKKLSSFLTSDTNKRFCQIHAIIDSVKDMEDCADETFFED